MYTVRIQTTCSKWFLLTTDALVTSGSLSAIPCFRYLSIHVRKVPSMIWKKTQTAFALHISVSLYKKPLWGKRNHPFANHEEDINFSHFNSNKGNGITSSLFADTQHLNKIGASSF